LLPRYQQKYQQNGRLREYAEFVSLISSFDLLPQTFAYAFDAFANSRKQGIELHA
jgi:hypothetical protein